MTRYKSLHSCYVALYRTVQRHSWAQVLNDWINGCVLSVAWRQSKTTRSWRQRESHCTDELRSQHT